MSQQQTHARVSQPGSDAGQRTTDDDLVDQAIDDAMEQAVSDNETLEHTDDLLDEIDRILTEEEEFAVRYVQKGGE